MVYLLTLFLLAGAPEDTNRTETLIADALGWYSMWMMEGTRTHRAQNCRGEHRGDSYTFRCDPFAVVGAALISDSGGCELTTMHPASDQKDGLRVAGPRDPTGGPPRGCGELPATEGPFDLTIFPRTTPVSDKMTRDARIAAVESNRRGGDRGCVLHLPIVRTGDPFFHVYEECDGVLSSIWEFTIRDAQVADFPHWTYTRRKGGFPAGSIWRIAQAELWSGASRPDERSKALRE